MSEEEIIKYIKDEIENETDTFHWFDNIPENKTRKQIEESINAHQGLLDLYQKEKEMYKNTGKIVKNKRDGKVGVVLREFETGQIQVLEKIGDKGGKVINTHDSWKTLEVIEMSNEINYEIDSCITDLDTLICLDKRAIKDLENNTHEIEQQEVLTIIREFIRLRNDYNKEKEKNKWKPISEYNRQKYDWVLVKYFDGDYECVPEVAEQRWDGKWYTSEKEIPFEVKYFFDMQELLEERN